MNELEQRLRNALRQRNAPPGFAERVMSHTGEASRSSAVRGRAWVAAAAIAFIVASGAFLDSEINRRARGERAKQEVLMALRVTGSALNSVSDQLRELRSRRTGSDSN